eukprot:scaffold30985_cov38-Cyclotella_meneghiniana.AAC.3
MDLGTVGMIYWVMGNYLCVQYGVDKLERVNLRILYDTMLQAVQKASIPRLYLYYSVIVAS